MKLYNKLKVLLPVVGIALACSGNKDQQADTVSDSVETEYLGGAQREQGIFSGKYLIGDGGAIIVPVGETFEMRNEKGETSDVLYFQGKEQDTLGVYANKDKSITFKMNPDHRSGMYYEPDEQWPVSFVKSIQWQETEGEETQGIMKQRHQEDSVAYAGLFMYDGTYEMQTESEGVDASLFLQYNGDQTFVYSWTFTVTADEVYCNAKREGTVVMDRTQHGSDATDACTVHFNFNGYSSDGYIVEIDFGERARCEDFEGECTFSGTYTKK